MEAFFWFHHYLDEILHSKVEVSRDDTIVQSF